MDEVITGWVAILDAKGEVYGFEHGDNADGHIAMMQDTYKGQKFKAAPVTILSGHFRLDDLVEATATAVNSMKVARGKKPD
jgi:hypothetical protein